MGVRKEEVPSRRRISLCIFCFCRICG